MTHWGHLHERTNEYLARFDIVGSADAWRIGALDLLEQERINQFDDPNGVDGDGGGFGPEELDEDFNSDRLDQVLRRMITSTRSSSRQ